MPSHAQMLATVTGYIQAFANGDTEAIVRLFSPTASVEDPVGTPVHRGTEAIRAFYAGAVAAGAKLTLQGPVRTAGRSAAFAFSVDVSMGARHRIDVIDTFTFDEDGKVVEMRAFWAPENVHAV